MSIFTKLYNAIYKSKHRFDDGSILDHYLPGNVIQFSRRLEPYKVINVPLLCDEQTGLERIDLSVPWTWSDIDQRGNLIKEDAGAISESELLDLYKKLEFFTAKSPRWFELFKDPNSGG